MRVAALQGQRDGQPVQGEAKANSSVCATLKRRVSHAGAGMTA